MGPTRVWRQLHREGIAVAPLYGRRTHASLGSARRHPRQAHPRHGGGSPATSYPVDPVNRQFDAERPNPLGVSDFTDVSAWQCLVYMAFIIDVFARRIVGGRVSRSMPMDFVLEALEQALHARQSTRDAALIHYSDRGSRYVSIRYSTRLAEAGIKPSVGSIRATETTMPWPRRSTGCTKPS